MDVNYYINIQGSLFVRVIIKVFNAFDMKAMWWIHGSALEGSDPHELAAGCEVCQMKGTHIGI